MTTFNLYKRRNEREKKRENELIRGREGQRNGGCKQETNKQTLDIENIAITATVIHPD